MLCRPRRLVAPALALFLTSATAGADDHKPGTKQGTKDGTKDGSKHGTMKGKSRPATIEHLMEGVVKPHADALKKLMPQTGKTPDSWKEIAMHAAVLNEASYTLTEDGRGIDTVWTDAASKAMRKGTADLLKATEAKDEAAAVTAHKEAMKSCKACHDVHKK